MTSNTHFKNFFKKNVAIYKQVIYNIIIVQEDVKNTW